MDKIKEMPKKELSANEIALLIGGWARGKLEPVLDLYEKHGIDIFRKLPEKYYKIKGDKITLYRALSPEEIEHGPIMFAGKDKEKRIQRLTSWTWDKKFADKWTGKDGKVISMEADQDDIAFAPLDISKHSNEKEVIIADYHLKKDKIKEDI